MKIAILSTTKLPKFLGDDHPNEDSLFAEDNVLAQAFAARGAEAERVPWRQTDVHWDGFDLVLIRSTWDYIDDLPAFLDVLKAIEASGTRLLNPFETIQWNASKRYLPSLAKAGVPIVPGAFHGPGQAPDVVLEALAPSDKGYVLKPLVGVGGFGTERLADRDALAARLARDVEGGPYLIQPFIESIVIEGEWSLVFGDHRFLYAALKTPRAGDFRVQVMYGAQTVGQAPAPADVEAASACLAALPVPVHLARIDMARLTDGRLALMEAELIEPQLYFHDVPGAADLVAEATLAHLGA